MHVGFFGIISLVAAVAGGFLLGRRAVALEIIGAVFAIAAVVLAFGLIPASVLAEHPHTTLWSLVGSWLVPELSYRGIICGFITGLFLYLILWVASGFRFRFGFISHHS